jgi:hypothetical protein
VLGREADTSGGVVRGCLHERASVRDYLLEFDVPVECGNVRRYRCLREVMTFGQIHREHASGRMTAAQAADAFLALRKRYLFSSRLLFALAMTGLAALSIGDLATGWWSR